VLVVTDAVSVICNFPGKTASSTTFYTVASMLDIRELEIGLPNVLPRVIATLLQAKEESESSIDGDTMVANIRKLSIEAAINFYRAGETPEMHAKAHGCGRRGDKGLTVKEKYTGLAQFLAVASLRFSVNRGKPHGGKGGKGQVPTARAFNSSGQQISGPISNDHTTLCYISIIAERYARLIRALAVCGSEHNREIRQELAQTVLDGRHVREYFTFCFFHAHPSLTRPF
jgi:hypothetical protein